MRQLEARTIPRGAAIVIDKKGYVAGWNEGAEVVLGFAAREVVGRACHHVLCGRDPEGRLVCHPWCPLSPKVEPADYEEDDIVMYSRSASRDVVCLTLSVLNVDGADGTPGWVVHEITSADVVPTGPMTTEYDDLPRVPRRMPSVPKRRTPKQH